MWGSELSEGEVEVGVGGQFTKGVKDRVDLISLLRALQCLPNSEKGSTLLCGEYTRLGVRRGRKAQSRGAVAKIT